MHFKHLSFFLLLTLFTPPAFCQSRDSVNVRSGDDSKMICLNIHVIKTDAHPEGEWTILNQTVISGKLKINGDTAIAHGKKGQGMIVLKDRAGKIITQTIVKNPLEQRTEYTRNNGEMSDTTLIKTEANISVRLPYTADCKKSELKVFKEDHNVTTISSLTIITGKLK